MTSISPYKRYSILTITSCRKNLLDENKNTGHLLIRVMTHGNSCTRIIYKLSNYGYTRIGITQSTVYTRQTEVLTSK